MANTAPKQSRTVPKKLVRTEPDTDAEEATPPAKRRPSLLKIVLLLTLLLSGAGGGAWNYFQNQGSEEATGPKTAKVAKATKAAKAAKAKQDASKPPVFVALEPFVVNLQQGDATSRYLQVKLVLKLTDDEFVEAIKLYMPEIRNRVLLLLSSKSATDLATSEGKKILCTELSREILQPLAGKVPARGLDSVLFTSFVIQ